MPGKVIYKVLSEDSAVTNLVGSSIYPVQIGQSSTYPAIAYTGLAVNPSDRKDGGSLLDVHSVQVSLFSRSYTVLSALTIAVRAALDRYVGSGAYAYCQHITYQGQNDQPFEEVTGVFHRAITFEVRIKN